MLFLYVTFYLRRPSTLYKGTLQFCHSFASPLLWRINNFSFTLFLYAFKRTKLSGGKFSLMLVLAERSGPLQKTDLRYWEFLYLVSNFSQVSWVEPWVGQSSAIVFKTGVGNNEGYFRSFRMKIDIVRILYWENKSLYVLGSRHPYTYN